MPQANRRGPGARPWAHGLGESVGSAAEIADGAESALEHADGAEDGGGRGELRVGGEVHHAGDDVDVAIDEARDDGAGFEVDDPAGGGGYAGVEVADEAAFNEDVAGARVRAGRVDDEAFCRRVCVVR